MRRTARPSQVQPARRLSPGARRQARSAQDGRAGERAIAEAAVLDAVRTLKLEVRQAFIDVQLAQENLALARENAASLQEIVTLNQARVRGGEVAEVELLRSRIAALQSQRAVRSAELRYARSGDVWSASSAVHLAARRSRLQARPADAHHRNCDGPAGARPGARPISARCSAPAPDRKPRFASNSRRDRSTSRSAGSTGGNKDCRPRQLDGPLFQHAPAVVRPEPGTRGARQSGRTAGRYPGPPTRTASSRARSISLRLSTLQLKPRPQDRRSGDARPRRATSARLRITPIVAAKPR